MLGLCYEWMLKGLDSFNWAELVGGVVIVWVLVWVWEVFLLGERGLRVAGRWADFFLERWVSWMRLATSFRGDRISLLFK